MVEVIHINATTTHAIRKNQYSAVDGIWLCFIEKIRKDYPNDHKAVIPNINLRLTFGTAGSSFQGSE